MRDNLVAASTVPGSVDRRGHNALVDESSRWLRPPHLSGEADGDISDILEMLNDRPGCEPQVEYLNVSAGSMPPVGLLRSLSLPLTSSRAPTSGMEFGLSMVSCTR